MCQRIGRLPIADHRLRDALRLLAHAHAEPAAEDDDLHRAGSEPLLEATAVPGLRTDPVARRDRDDELRAPLRGVGELRADLAREVPGQDHDHVGPRLGDPLGRVDRDVRPRRVLALLVRVPVDRVVEEVRPDAAVVEQRVALAGRAVADDLLALAPQPDQELEQRALRLLDTLGEARGSVSGSRRPCASSRASSSRDGRRPARRPPSACCRKTRSEPPWLGSSSTSTTVEPVRARRSRGSRGARSTRSARGRSCRTRGARAASRGAGTRTSPSRPARAAPRRRRRSR